MRGAVSPSTPDGRVAYTRRLPALVAQWIEHLTTDQKVGGSTPSERAELVQVTAGFGLVTRIDIDDDAWLTVRRDAVRHGHTIARWIGLNLETWARPGDVEES